MYFSTNENPGPYLTQVFWLVSGTMPGAHVVRMPGDATAAGLADAVPAPSAAAAIRAAAAAPRVAARRNLPAGK